MSTLSVYVSVLVFYTSWAIKGVVSQCTAVELCCAKKVDLNTKYVHANASLCSEKPLYEAQSGSFYLYYHDFYWQVQHQPCFYGLEKAMLRVYSMAPYPEDVVGIWEEPIDGGWRENENITVVCYEESGTEPGVESNTIIGICVGVVVVFFLMLPTFVHLGKKCAKKNRPSATPPHVITRATFSQREEQTADEYLPPAYDNLALDMIEDIVSQSDHSISDHTSFDPPPPNYENSGEYSRPHHSEMQDPDVGTTFEPPPPSYEEVVTRSDTLVNIPPPYSSVHTNSSFVDEHDESSTNS